MARLTSTSSLFYRNFGLPSSPAFFLAALLPAFLVGCGSYSANSGVDASSSQATQNSASGSFNSLTTTLPFGGVAWPDTLSVAEQPVFEIGLTLSGSYEGNQGWSNLTNNFDGEGLSMGLLNQTLGTGSLQPLMLEMSTRFPTHLAALLSTAHLQSLMSMLTTYHNATHSLLQLRGPAGENGMEEAARGLTAPPGFALADRSPLDDVPQLDIVSRLDVESTTTTATSPTPLATCVQWAVNNLYTGTSFKSDWKTQLNALGTDPGYISIQIEAAMKLFTLARGYQTKFNLLDLRSFLFFFDIAVQNGSLYSADVTDYQSWLAQQSALPSVQARLTEILTLRLRHVRSQYVADVKSRKMAIILGQGIVHGDARNVGAEYGVSLDTPVP